MKRKYTFILFIAGALILLQGCQKEFLDKKPNKALLVPVTLSDFQSLLDNLAVMNTVPAIERLGTDDYYTSESGLQNYSTADQRNSYIWAKDIYQGNTSIDWNNPYRQILYANIVLDGLDKIDASSPEFRAIKGTALFFRATAYYYLAQLYAKPYQATAATTDPGIPLHLNSNVNERPGRGSVQVVYERILSDLNDAASLLPPKTALKSRPSQTAALAFLSRVYLTMGDYANTERSATAALGQQSDLLDFSKLDTTTYRPFPASLPNGNEEVIFHAVAIAYDFYYSSETGVDSTVLKTYAPNDLRRPLFFYFQSAPFVSFNDTYAGTAGFFAGIATDEIYLNQVEALVRQDKVQEGLKSLNALLVKRFKQGTFIPLTAGSRMEALKLVLKERRKEMFTNQGIMRWVDLRRLNLEPEFAVTLKRVINGQTYLLPPNDNRYVYPIPDDEIQNSKIAQNPR